MLGSDGKKKQRSFRSLDSDGIAYGLNSIRKLRGGELPGGRMSAGWVGIHLARERG